MTDKFILLMLGVFPLWTGFDGYADITRAKFLFFAVATSLWIVLTLICAIIAREKPNFSSVSVCAVVFAAAACVSAVFSPLRRFVLIGVGRYDGLSSLLLYCAIFVGVTAYGKRKPLYLKVFAASMCVCCAVGILQLFGLDPFDLFPGGYTYYDSGKLYTGEFLGTIGNVDLLCALLVIAVPVLFLVYIINSKPFALLPASFLLYVGLLCGVSAFRLALIVGCAVGLPFVIKKEHTKRLVFALLTVVFVCICAHFTPLGLHSSAFASDISTLGSGRLEIWSKLLSMVKERPLLGGGPGTVAMRVNITWSRYVEETGRTLSVYVDNAHNEYLGYLLDLGALGLASYLLMVLITSVTFIKKHRTSLAVGICCYFVQSFFGLGLCLVLPVIWTLWALSCVDNTVRLN